MLVHSLKYRGFRNLKTGEFNPGSGVNIIYGSNAQGKTNLLEALWLFTGGRSFRGAKDREMIKFGESEAEINLNFNAEERDREARIKIISGQLGRRASLGGIEQPSPTALAGIFRAVVFSPAHLSLIREGPEGRRKFIDAAYCQLRPGYIKILSEYQRTLTQRNTLLRRIRESGMSLSAAATQLDIWDNSLAKTGAQVYAARSAYIRKITGPAAEIYSGISKGKELLSLHYESFALTDETPAEAAVTLLAQLEKVRDADMRAGFTSVGPHRDNLRVLIDNKDTRLYASQGQQRSSVLALKLAEASVLTSITGEYPVAILDDVMSELDIVRQDYILNHIDGWQVFLTCCDSINEKRISDGASVKIFTMTDGRLEQE